MTDRDETAAKINTLIDPFNKKAVAVTEASGTAEPAAVPLSRRTHEESPSTQCTTALPVLSTATSTSGPFPVVDTQVRARCSVGVVLSDGRTGADELITRADQAMYRAKQRQHATA